MSVVELSPEIAVCSTILDNNFHKDPFDRIIVATAICKDATLITKDCAIIEWSKCNDLKMICA